MALISLSTRVHFAGINSNRILLLTSEHSRAIAASQKLIEKGLSVTMSKLAVLLLIFAFVFVTYGEEQKREGCPCPRIYMPVCASNGKTFPNECEFECVAKSREGHGMRIVKMGECDDMTF